MKKKHRGLHEHRFRDNPDERRFAKAWREQQHGKTLDYLLTPSDSDQRFPLPATERDEVVAATVVQWLGSPVGQNFLSSCGFVRARKKTP
jgi:hypothetical protein